jgi:hypothetical protein
MVCRQFTLQPAALLGFGLELRHGALAVVNVLPGSAVDKAGVIHGARLVAVDDTPLRYQSWRDVVVGLREMGLVVWNGGMYLSATCTVVLTVHHSSYQKDLIK